MKNALLTILLVILTISAIAQDLIVTNEGDSINCKITDVKTDYIYFSFKYQDEIRSTLLQNTDVKTHQFDFYQSNGIPEDKIIGFQDFQRWRIALNGGYGYHIARVSKDTPRDLTSYAKKLKSGYVLGGDASYFITEHWGIGIKANMCKSTNSLDNIYVEDISGHRRYGKMSDDITVFFIAPTFSSRYFDKEKKNSVYALLSIGYLGYKNNYVVIDKYQLTGSTLGTTVDIGYDIGLNEKLALGFQFSFLTGYLLEYTLKEGTHVQKIKLEDQVHSLNRIEFSVGLRFVK